MRHDPIEIAVLEASRRRKRQPANRAALKASSSRRFDAATLPEPVIDEAFATLPQAPPQALRANSGAREAEPILLSDIAAQVANLDRQCARLSKLVQDLASASLAGR